MLTAEENAQLTRVEPGTLIGDLMRQYWIPVVLSSELAPGGRVKRVKILGEDLVAFRTPSGRVGLLGEFCARQLVHLVASHPRPDRGGARRVPGRLGYPHHRVRAGDERGLRRHPAHRQPRQRLPRRLGGPADAEVLRRAGPGRPGQGPHRVPGRLRPLARATGPGGSRHHPRTQALAGRGHRPAHPGDAAAGARSRALSRPAGLRAPAEGRPVGGGGEGAAGRPLPS